MPDFHFTPNRFHALTASPIPEVREAAEAYHHALDELGIERDERSRIVSALERADATDEAALMAALAAGRPAPVPVDRNALTVRLADTDRRIAARTRLAVEAQNTAVTVAVAHAEPWAAACDQAEREARAALTAAVDAASEAAAQLDALTGMGAAARHLLAAPHPVSVRGKFLEGLVRGDDSGKGSEVRRALAMVRRYRAPASTEVEHTAPGAPMSPADLEFFHRTGHVDPWAGLARGDVEYIGPDAVRRAPRDPNADVAAAIHY